MISSIAASISCFSRMSLTSISDPAKANDRMSDSASCTAYRNISRNCAIGATEPDTSHSTITRGFSMRFCFHTVMNGMPPQPMFRRMRAPHVQLPAQPPPPRLRIARRQLLRHRAHQHAHAVQVAPLQIRQPCALQQFLAEPLRLAAREQHQVPFDEVAQRVAQRLDPRFQPAGADDRRVVAALPHRLDLAFQRAQTHAIQDAPRIEILLREEPDVLQSRLACRLLHRRGQRRAIVVQQHLPQRLRRRPGRPAPSPLSVGSRADIGSAQRRFHRVRRRRIRRA